MLLCDVFLVTHVGEFTHLRPLHTQMSQVVHALPPCSFSRASYSKTKKKTPTVAHLSVPLQSFNLLWLKVKEKVRWNYIQWTSSRLSSYRHGIWLSIQLKLRCDPHNTFPFLDCSLPFLPGGEKKNYWVFGQFCGAPGTGSGTHGRSVALGPSAH